MLCGEHSSSSASRNSNSSNKMKNATQRTLLDEPHTTSVSYYRRLGHKVLERTWIKSYITSDTVFVRSTSLCQNSILAWDPWQILISQNLGLQTVCRVIFPTSISRLTTSPIGFKKYSALQEGNQSKKKNGKTLFCNCLKDVETSLNIKLLYTESLTQNLTSKCHGY